jgi:hypothetical protein
MKPTYYLSVDIETDGMCPGVNSMISLGAVMLDEQGTEVGEFSANLEPLGWPAVQNQETMKWWATQPEAWAAATKDPQMPGVVMHNFRHWCESFEGRVIFIGYPVTFDFTFVWYYLWAFTGGSPFTHGGLDIKTMAADALEVDYYDARKSQWPPEWHPPEGFHTHVAVEDAREQAYSFLAIRRTLAKRLHPPLTVVLGGPLPPGMV